LGRKRGGERGSHTSLFWEKKEGKERVTKEGKRTFSKRKGKSLQISYAIKHSEKERGGGKRGKKKGKKLVSICSSGTSELESIEKRAKGGRKRKAKRTEKGGRPSSAGKRGGRKEGMASISS